MAKMQDTVHTSAILNEEKLDALIDGYVTHFTDEWWQNEKYKWEAVEHFQQNWDISAEDFPAMLKTALAKTDNLLMSRRYFPNGMIVELAKLAPDAVRQMFIDLFDESEDYIQRIASFREKTDQLMLLQRSNDIQHYQTENAISTYLWLRFPEKYSIFKFTELKNLASIVEYSGTVKQGHVEDNLRSFLELSTIISQRLLQHKLLVNLLESKCANDGFPHSYPKLLMTDLSFFSLCEAKKTAAPQKTDAKVKRDDEARAERTFNTSSRRFWWLNANPKVWSMRSLAVNEEQSYTLYNHEGNRRRIGRNFDMVQAGDLVIGYESTPVKKIVALCEITAPSDGERIYFRKLEAFETPIPFSHVQTLPELAHMEGMPNVQGSLFAMTEEEFSALMDVIREENPSPHNKSKPDFLPYSREDFLDEVFMSHEQMEYITAALRHNKNIILQGAPGVGKTFAARRLAWMLMGCKDDSRIEFVQFHQSYSYEDFVMGYKPSTDGFELRNGVFYRFCKRAANHPDQEFYFIIDEINRGNLSKIFGELLTLIEKDYRGTSTSLVYDGLPFSVPSNLYIIGMMNTADRSLAFIDYALRRRFGFISLTPAFDSGGFLAYQQSLKSPLLNNLLRQVKALNRAICEDRTLGSGFQIGHSHFCGLAQADSTSLHNIVEFDLIPTLSEYWFDNEASVESWSSALREAIRGE